MLLDWDAFGKEWAIEYKGDQKALPTVNEIMVGVGNWYVQILKKNISHKHVKDQLSSVR